MNISEFVSQGGYAAYVWGAYGLAAVLMIAEVFQLRAKRRTIIARISRILRLRSQEKNQ